MARPKLEKEWRYTPISEMQFTTEKYFETEKRKVVNEDGTETEKEVDVEKEHLYVEGYAVTFEKPQLIGDEEYGWVEIIDRHAFDNTDFKQCCYKYNHGDAMGILGRPSNGSLTWRIDDKGVYIKNRLPNTQVGRDFHTLVKDGYITQQSFAFTVRDEIVDRSKTPIERRVTDIGFCFDFSGVDNPAYDTTSLMARSKAMAAVNPDELENSSTEEEELENKPIEGQEEQPKAESTELENEVAGAEDIQEAKPNEEEHKRKVFEFKKRQAIAKLKIGGFWDD